MEQPEDKTKEESGIRDSFIFRSVRQSETDQIIEIEQICFPPHEACSAEDMRKRVAAAPDFFLVAEDRGTGKLAGFLNGLATEETKFRDEFFTDPSLHDPSGTNIMLLGLDVLPEYRHRGLARELVSEYARRTKEDGKKTLVLTCLPDKVKMYEKMGFIDLGISGSNWGGEQWYEMIRNL